MITSTSRARLRAFADEVGQLHGWTFTGEPDQYRERLRRVWAALYELWGSERESQPYRGLLDRDE